MNHTHRTCIERPRKVGAEFSGENIGRDDLLVEAKLNYEGKRDRWNGYDPATYKHVIEEWNALDKERDDIR
jgi:pre-mRNA-processing factor SLU7